jgi:uroporphyrinogen-III synthase
MDLPLQGKTVLVTRRREQSADLRDALQGFGATVEFFPTIEVLPLDDWTQCDRVLQRIPAFTMIVFPSINAVTFFLHRCVALGIGPETLSHCELAAVGRKTAAELERLKLHPDHLPEQFSGAALLELFSRKGVRGENVLVPRGSLGREELVEGLRSLGAIVETVTVYRTVAPDPKGSGEILRRIGQGAIDVITFASPSAVRNFAALLPGSTLASRPGRSLLAAIGPTTAAEVRLCGVEPDIIARESSSRGLAEAVATHYRRSL